jgi:hypothetical protein
MAAMADDNFHNRSVDSIAKMLADSRDSQLKLNKFLRLSRFPIAGATAAMRDCDDLDGSFCGTVNDEIRVSSQ